MKHSLQLRLSQHLTLTPQLQQSIRLLQLSTLELSQEIERMLQENPLLEREDTPVGEEPALLRQPGTTSDAPAERTAESSDSGEPREVDAAEPSLFDGDGGDFSGGGTPRDDTDEPDYPQVAAETQSLREHLLGQLAMLNLSERDRQLVALLVDSLNDDGYLQQDLAELAALLPPELEIEPEDLTVALKHLQYLDPAGVGARSLAECLALQLETLPPEVPHRDLARTVVNQHLELLAARDFNKLRKQLSCDDTALKCIQSLITGLNPRPGASFAGGEARYVVSDVIVKKVKGVWLAALNPDAMPKLRINRLYADILSRSRDSGHQQLASQLQEAKWLIKNVQQRFDTILRVSQAIVDRQRHFFEHGEVAMRPLVLREIAEVLDLHESTVSRVTTQKFMLTPRGIFELKYFFGSHVTTETGGSASSTAIRALIKQLVTAENTKKPLSDSQISEILGQQGIVVARRTVAKYRESMHILPVNLRKSL
jgi:RNA polymerase sigma-54 factor